MFREPEGWWRVPSASSWTDSMANIHAILAITPMNSAKKTCHQSEKRCHSVLQGLLLSSHAGPCDTNCNFQWANMGAYWSSFDCGIFNRLSLSQSSTKKPRLCLHQRPSHAMTEAFPISSLDTMPFPWRLTSYALPPQGPLPHYDRDISYFIIGDNAFPLKTYLISPASSSTLPTHWQRHFLFHYWRQCLPPVDLPHKSSLFQHPSYTLTEAFPISSLETMPSPRVLTS